MPPALRPLLSRFLLRLLYPTPDSMPYRYVTLLLFLLAAPAFAQEAWAPAEGPTPGDVTALTVTPSGEIYASTYEGIRRSADDGETWDFVSFGSYASLARAIAVVPGQYLFAGTQQTVFSEPEAVHGMVKLVGIDGAPPTYETAWGAAGTDVADIVASADGAGWAAIGSAVFRYTPATAEWTSAVLPVEAIYDLHRGAGSGLAEGVLLAATSDGLYRSTDGGASWSPYALAGNLIQAVTVGATGTTFASDEFGIVYRSDDPAVWSPISCGGVVLRLHPLPDGTVIGGTEGLGLVRTVNDGWSWHYAGGDEVVPAVGGDASGMAYAAAAGDGIRISDDSGASWEVRRWIDADVRHLLTLPDGHVLAASNQYYGAHLYNDGAWLDRGLDGEEVYALEAAGSVLYALVQEHGYDTELLRSDDGGLTWSSLRVFEFANATLGVGDGGALLVTTHKEHLRSEDGGLTWETVPSAPTQAHLHHAGDGLFFSHSGGYPDVLARSTDNGLTWTELGSPIVGDEELPAMRAITRAEGGTLLAADEDGVMRSADEGLTWEMVPGSPDHVVAFVHDGGTLWAARAEGFIGEVEGYGVWRSDDGGLTWAPDGMEDRRVRALALGADDTLLAGTASGVYVRLGTPVDAEPPAAQPTELAVSAYPNPLRTAGTLTLALPTSAAVQVTVYDMQGRGVAVAVDRPFEAGTHTVPLDASGLASGIYLVRVQSGAKVAMHRFTVIR